MRRRLAIVASAQSNHEAAKDNMTPRHMVFATVRRLLDESCVPLSEIDMVVSASCDMIDGRSISNVYTTSAMGSHLKEESKIEEDGAFAFIYACMRILTGQLDSAIVASYAKMSECGSLMASWMATDPFFQRPLGLTRLTASALQARAYMERYSVDEEAVAALAVKNRRNAQKNPYAQRRSHLHVDDVISSPYLAEPIREETAAPDSDGVCAIIIATEEKAKQWTPDPVWVRGFGHCSDAFAIGRRNLRWSESAARAARDAYRMAGIGHPEREIDLAEVSDFYAFHEFMLTESFGFCEQGSGAMMFNRGETRPDGHLPVNLSGGALNAAPGYATGLIRIAEAALQLSGRAGERQVPGEPVTALAHGTTGPCLQSNAVVILSNNPS